MKVQVLYRELFQIVEQIKQIDYKISKQNHLPSKEILQTKKEKLIQNRNYVKAMVQAIYSNDMKENSGCIVA